MPIASPNRGPRHRRPISAAGMPAYLLYGEAVASAALAPLDMLHVESIAARSRQHGWEIRPHRHESLCQLLLVRRGAVQAQLDGRTHRLAGPAVVTVPSLAAHGFVFSDDVDGWVFTVVESQLRELLGRDAALAAALLRLRAAELPARAKPTKAVLKAADALRAELADGRAAWRASAVEAALMALAVAVLRAWPADQLAMAPAPSRALAHVQRLRTLVDAQFRSQPSLATLAGEIGITATQLNRACQQVLGHSASAVLHGRLLLEAQRELAYTALSVKHIALELGFCEAGYFARFYRRSTGLTPTEWRAQVGAAALTAWAAPARPARAPSSPAPG